MSIKLMTFLLCTSERLQNYICLLPQNLRILNLILVVWHFLFASMS